MERYYFQGGPFQKGQRGSERGPELSREIVSGWTLKFGAGCGQSVADDPPK